MSGRDGTYFFFFLNELENSGMILMYRTIIKIVQSSHILCTLFPLLLFYSIMVTYQEDLLLPDTVWIACGPGVLHVSAPASPQQSSQTDGPIPSSWRENQTLKQVK